MFQRIGAAAYKRDLTNTIALCALLDNPQENLQSIHIAGTNGKGSVAHMLAAVYQAAGMKVGIYSSPHLLDFRERIKINGEMISEAEVTDFTQRMMPYLESNPSSHLSLRANDSERSNPVNQSIAPLQPSFFEITVAIAFEHFARHHVDLGIIETGLGGRLDSTNVITPLLSIITNITLEHQQFLGNTLAEIAGEKAGIIKPGVPVVIGERHPETENVFRAKATECDSDIVFADNAHPVTLTASTIDSITVRDMVHGDLVIGCGAHYQLRNLPAVLAAIDALPQLPYDIHALAHFKELTGFLGRWDILSREPLVIADGAHNPEGLAQVFVQVSALGCAHVRVVFGLVKDKDVDAVLPVLPKDATYYFCKPDMPRGLEADELKSKAEQAGLNGRSFDLVQGALAAAMAKASGDDVVLICGSLFVVAEGMKPTPKLQRAALH